MALQGVPEVEDRGAREQLKVKTWVPQQLELLNDIYSGETAYLWRIPADYKEQVRRGNLFALERCPKQVISAIQHDNLFKFHPDLMFHMREPALNGRVAFRFACKFLLLGLESRR